MTSQTVFRSANCRAAGLAGAVRVQRSQGAHSSSYQGSTQRLCACNSARRTCGQSAFLRGLESSRAIRKVTTRMAVQATAELQTLSQSEAVPVKEADGVLQKFPASPAVYAVYDSNDKLQYIGLSRKVSASIEVHSQDLPEMVSKVKVNVLQTADRAALQAAWKSWIEEYIQESGKVPPGNVSGNEAWTKRKARAAKPEIRLTPGAHVKLTVPLEVIIDKVVKDVPVVAFIKGTRTAPQCGFSHKVLTLLNESRVDYEVVNVLDEDHNPGLREAIKRYSQWPTIPQVFVKGEFTGGADILEEVVQKNELKPLVSK